MIKHVNDCMLKSSYAMSEILISCSKYFDGNGSKCYAATAAFGNNFLLKFLYSRELAGYIFYCRESLSYCLLNQNLS